MGEAGEIGEAGEAGKTNPQSDSPELNLNSVEV